MDKILIIKQSTTSGAEEAMQEKIDNLGDFYHITHITTCVTARDYILITVILSPKGGEMHTK